MKKYHSLVSTTVLAVSLFLPSCNKENEVSKTNSEEKAQITVTTASTSHQWNDLSIEEKKKIILSIKEDPDWQVIVEQNAFLMDKLINSKYDIDAIDFKNEAAFLEAIGIDRDDYLARVKATKESAKRLVEKFNMLGISPSTCTSCNEGLYGSEASIAEFKALAKTFKNDPSLNTKFLAKMTNGVGLDKRNKSSVVSATNGVPKGDESISCPLDAYICVALCAATIEAFPVYLGCCYLCYKSYC